MVTDTARERAISALRAHVPQCSAGEITELGHGLDNTVFVAGELVE